MELWENQLVDNISFMQWNYINLCYQWIIGKTLKDKRVKEMQDYIEQIYSIMWKVALIESEFKQLNTLSMNNSKCIN